MRLFPNSDPLSPRGITQPNATTGHIFIFTFGVFVFLQSIGIDGVKTNVYAGISDLKHKTPSSVEAAPRVSAATKTPLFYQSFVVFLVQSGVCAACHTFFNELVKYIDIQHVSFLYLRLGQKLCVS